MNQIQLYSAFLSAQHPQYKGKIVFMSQNKLGETNEHVHNTWYSIIFSHISYEPVSFIQNILMLIKLRYNTY